MANYKISVIISTYNTGNYLNEFLDSIKAQSMGFDNIEVIFVDDKSTDEYTLNLLKEFDESYQNVKSIFLDNNSGFPGTGRNVGLKNANADYVIFADHDDTYTKNAFEVMHNKIAQNDMLISNFNQVYTDKSIPFKSIYGDKGEIEVSSFRDDENLLRVPAAIWTRLFRKDFLIENDIRFLEGMLAEDVYVATYACLKADGIIYLNDFYSYNYKIRDSRHNKSTIHVRNRKYIEAILNGYYKIDEMLVNINQTSYGELIFKSHLTSWLYTIVLSQVSDADKKELFIKSRDIFSKYYSEDPFFKKRYNNLVELILNQEYDKAVLESNRLSKTQKNMNDRSLFSRIKNRLVR
ncbi:MAG: glycosyltransferase [Methanobrevibacter sp.]|uniref:glycosyltransferase family 2 protein n=1 Tax=Methanobrevibacter sp. TaxID=66852 RepID=UPI0025F48FF5|nr:glycosyltransferase [Methanobrevibacter sp.]MBR0270954.1 glycosyltransferase [Methanobrevibacter sp.]